jgi:hypothetical protein
MRVLTPAQETIAKAMSEAALEENVRVACRDLGLMYYHTHRAQHSPAGFPDDVIVGNRVIYRELKRQREKPSPAQQEWLDRLEAVGEDVGVWRPSDWLDGTIIETLRGLSARH